MIFKNRFLYIAILLAVVLPLTSFAVRIPNPLNSNDFQTLIDRLVDLVFTAGLALAPISVIIAGILFMTAQGEPGKIQTAQNIIKWTFIGLLIIVCSKGLVTLIRTTLGG